MKIALLLGLLAAVVTAALIPALAGSSGDANPPPVVTITAGPAGPTNVTTATFLFTANETDAHFSCSLDGAKFSPCAAPLSYTGLGNGEHTFQVYAEHDGRGPTASWSWAVDTVPPAPVGGVHASVRYGKLRLSWTPGPDTDHVVILRSVGANTTAKQVYAGAGTSYSESKFVNGLEHRYNFMSYDKAGNVSPPTGIVVGHSALLLAPSDGATVRRAHKLFLRWRAVGRARFYNVQLWRGKSKVLSAWPHRAAFRLSRDWKFDNREYHLKPGLYAWFVWPAFGRSGTYGKLVGSATFRVR
ncbi:MAG TPA: hypothetical protein VIW19_05890 [Gaiellaceae bacterium]